MLWAQWGLADRIAADPSVWLCHQCNDCTQRCPRDAKPGDVLSVVRALTIEKLAFPGFIGSLVGKVRVTWPLVLGVPILFWVLLLVAVNGLQVPQDFRAYEQFVPHWLLYAVYFPVAGWVVLASWMSGRRFWALLGQGAARKGSFLSHLWPALVEIGTHKRFGNCTAARPRKIAHLALLWGFVGAAVTSGLLIMAIYVQGMTLDNGQMPLSLWHPYKILGNISAVLLVVGGVLLVANRLQDGLKAGASTAFDSFFLTVVGLVIVTGVLTEAGRFAFTPELACALYVVHLGVVLCLFVTFPYSKFAHMLYRTLAMVHARMAGIVSPRAK